MEYNVEVRYRGVPREAGPVVRQWLRDYKDQAHSGIPVSDVTSVRRVGLDGNGFVVCFRTKSGGHMSTTQNRALMIAEMAMEYAFAQGVCPPNPVAYYVRVEAVA